MSVRNRRLAHQLAARAHHAASAGDQSLLGGVRNLYTPEVRAAARRLGAEFLGTFFVVLAAASALVADSWRRAANQPPLGTLGAALAYGLAVAAMTEALAPVSGGHLNPAISLAAWVGRRLSTASLLGYAASQLLGGIAAAWVLRALAPESAWRAAALGTPALAAPLTRIEGMALEAILTFAVTLVFFRTAIVSGKPSGWAVGSMVAAVGVFAAPFTGAALNPARAFGPAIISHQWANIGIWWVGPLTGGALAGWLAGALGAAPG